MTNKSSKNIVLCLDGTNNQFKEDNSNIVKLARILKKDANKQIVYYDPGVGTLADPAHRTMIFKTLSKVKGLVLGRGMKDDIREAYSFIMNNYEEGDRVFVFGFSRGAYTARSVAGLIQSCGLLEKGNTNLLPYALEMFQSKNINFEVLAKFKHTFGRKCEIELLGLWDTVRSLGWSIFPKYHPYTLNNKSVKAVRHALSIDEKRVFFKPLLWGDKYIGNQDIKEVWFAGVHSDIGGGYPESESGLAKISLKWMVEEINREPFNVLIELDKYKYYVLGEGDNNDYIGPKTGASQHNSLTWGWKLTQYLPIGVWDQDTKSTKIKIVGENRFIKEGSTLHQSVIERLKNHNYNPVNVDLKNIHIYSIESTQSPS